MSFDFQISADPARALSALGQVERKLAATEAQARNLNGQFLAFGGNSEPVARVSNAMGEAAAKIRASARASDEMAQKLDLQRKILDRLHGPMERHRKEVQAIDALYRRNIITMQERNAEMLRSAQLAGVEKGSKAGGLGLGGAAGKLGIAVGTAAMAREALQLTNAYQSLQNRLRTVATDQGNLNSLMEKTREIANASRQDWTATTEGFTRLFHATKELGMSQDQVLTLTDRLNKAIVLSGASSQEAHAGLIQLSQGMASGALRGDELRSVLEQLPAVADVIAKGLGVTRGQLRSLGEQGKITTSVIIDAFNKAGSEIDANFGKTVPTLSQQWTVFKNELTNAIGKLSESARVSEIFGLVLGGVADVLKLAISMVGGLLDVLSPLIDVVIAVGEAARKAIKAIGGFIFAGTGVTDMLEAQKVNWIKNTAEGHRYIFMIQKARNEIMNLGDDMVASLQKATAEARKSGLFGRMFGVASAANKAVGIATSDPWGESLLEKGVRALGLGRDKKRKGRKGPHQMTAAELETQRALGEINETATAAAGIVGMTSKVGADLSAAAREFASVGKEYERQQARINKMAADYILHLDEIKKKWVEWALASDDAAARASAAFQVWGDAAKESLGGAIKTVADGFAEWIATGKMQWKDLVQTILRDIARMLVFGAIKTGMSAAGIKLPGFATGGQFTVGGGGGTDSVGVAFRATPGERVTVETPEQQREAAAMSRSGQGGGQPIAVVNQIDGSFVQAAMMSPGGIKVIHNAIKADIAGFRTLLGIR